MYHVRSLLAQVRRVTDTHTPSSMSSKHFFRLHDCVPRCSHPGAVSFLVVPRFDTFRTSHSRASAYGSLHEPPSSVSTVLVPHRSVPSRQAHGWPLWCDIVRGGRPLCSYAVARRWHPIQGPMAHALSTVFDSSGPILKHGGRCAHRTRGYHHQLHDRSTSSSLCSG